MKAKKWMILLALAPLALAGCEDPGKEDASSTDPNSTLSASSSPASHGGSSSIQEDKSESLSSRPEETGSSSSSIVTDPVTSGSSSIPDSEPDPEPPLEEPQEIDASAQDIVDKFLEIYEARQYRVTHTIGGVEYVDYYTPRYITNELPVLRERGRDDRRRLACDHRRRLLHHLRVHNRPVQPDGVDRPVPRLRLLG